MITLYNMKYIIYKLIYNQLYKYILYIIIEDWILGNLVRLNIYIKVRGAVRWYILSQIYIIIWTNIIDISYI